MTKFGFDALNKNQNPNTNTLNTNVGLNKENLDNLILIGRVIDIVLDENHPSFNLLGEWTSLGTIEFVNTKIQSTKTSPGTSKLFAKPLFPNLKNYPIFNEIVYILTLPDQGVMNDGSSNQYYYLNSINVWNHPHHNAVPFFISSNDKSQNKNYQATSLGNTNKTKSSQSSINLGPGFKEYSNIHPLLPYLGDYIIEGRWGNSIRLGSTVKNNSNSWSTKGENGNPITIIRNGQPKDSTNEGWIPITENINNDLSTMYLTSNQIIPLKLFETPFSSYLKPPINVDKYDGAQAIISSERLILNSTKDNLLMFSPNSIGLCSNDSVNIDSKNLFVLSSKTIKLGNKETTNPMVKGNETVDAIGIICDNLISMANALSTLAEIFPTSPQVGVNIAASEAAASINMLKGNLNSLKSNTNFLI